jgi:hypothetical protein
MHVIAVILGCLAILALNQPPLWANLIFALVVFTSLGLLIFFEISLRGDAEYRTE